MYAHRKLAKKLSRHRRAPHKQLNQRMAHDALVIQEPP
jgi:hypothetical protein